MWWLSQTGGQDTRAENPGWRELRNLGLVMRTGHRTQASCLTALPALCSEDGRQEHQISAWVQGLHRAGEGLSLRNSWLALLRVLEPTADRTQSHQWPTQYLLCKKLRRCYSSLGEHKPLNNMENVALLPGISPEPGCTIWEAEHGLDFYSLLIPLAKHMYAVHSLHNCM